MEFIEDKTITLEVNFTKEEKSKLNEALALITDLITKCEKYGDDIIMNDHDGTYYSVDELSHAGATICTFMNDVQESTFTIG